MSSLYLLWDEAHIWGLLAWRAFKAMGLPLRPVRAQEIAQGAFSGKRAADPAVAGLIVPGGVARRKAELLGRAGMDAIREYVDGGGVYIGFCGGTGLGLTGKDGLKLCPWARAAMRDRMLHLVSGHMRVAPARDNPLTPEQGAVFSSDPLLPVWWPARFAPEENSGVRVLATYEEPGDDFWLADLPFSTIPKGTFSQWEELYDVRLRPASLTGQPCMIEGDYGKGRYVLSYAHLETPMSPEANLWLAHILRQLTGLESPRKEPVPRWELAKLAKAWDHPVLVRARRILDELIDLGKDHFLLFQRNCWLLGWRSGIPGSHLNNLFSLMCEVMHHEPTDAAQAYLEENGPAFAKAMERFLEEARGYLLAERLAMTLAKSLPDAVSQKGLVARRTALFGQAMESGGLYAELLEFLDELMWLQLRETT